MKTFRGNTSWLALVGAGFFWGWLDCLVAQGTLYEPFGSLDLVDEAYLLTYAASVLPALIALLLPLRTDRLTVVPAIGPSIGLAGTLGCALVMAGGSLAQVGVFWTGVVLAGLALGGLLLFWGRVCVCQGSTHAFVHITGAYAVSLVIDLLVLFLRPLPAAAFLALCPLVSGGLFWVLARHSDDGKELALGSASTYGELGDDVAPDTDVRFEAKLVAIILSFYTVLGFANFVSNPSSMGTLGSQFYGVAWEITGVVLFGCVVILGWRARKVSLFGTIMLVAAAVVTLLPLSTEAVHILSSSFMSAGCIAFDIICWSLVALIHHFTRRPYVQTIGIVALCQQAGSLLGYAAGVVFPQAETELELYAPIVLVLCAGLIAGIQYVRHSNKKLLSALFSDETVGDLPDTPHGPAFPGGAMLSLVPTAAALQAVERELESGAAGAAEPYSPEPAGIQETSAEDAPPHVGERPERIATIERLSDEYHLTRREREVFAHLAKGRSAPYIAEVYQVSENTVRSHIKHIYTKLDVHSRQELLSFVRDFE